MKLYYKPGACSLAVHIVLRELGLDFELDAVSRETGRTESGQDYREIQPSGYVPALQLEVGEPLTECVAITQYLADEHPESGLAPRPATLERAHFNALLNWLSSELHKAFTPFFKQQLDDAGRARAREHLESRMDGLEQRFADGRAFTTGDRFTIADAYTFVITGWPDRLGIGLDRWPRIVAFRERVAQRDSVRDALRAEGLLEESPTG